MFLGIFKRKEVILAQPFSPIGIFETGLISGLSSLSFVIAGPVLAGYLGGYFACYTSGYTLKLTALSGASGGLAAGISGSVLTKIVYKNRYDSWLKENGGRYIINKYGQLEKLPLAFIRPVVSLSPVGLYATFILLISMSTFIYTYKKVKKNNDNTINTINAIM